MFRNSLVASLVALALVGCTATAVVAQPQEEDSWNVVCYAQDKEGNGRKTAEFRGATHVYSSRNNSRVELQYIEEDRTQSLIFYNQLPGESCAIYKGKAEVELPGALPEDESPIPASAD